MIRSEPVPVLPGSLIRVAAEKHPLAEPWTSPRPPRTRITRKEMALQPLVAIRGDRRHGLALEQGVSLADPNDLGPERLRFVFVDGAITEHDDPVSGQAHAGGRSVEHHRARSRLGFDDVGHQSGTVVEVQDVNLFAGEHIGRLQQIAVDRNASLVIQFRTGQRGPVDLGLKHDALHEILPERRGIDEPRGARGQRGGFKLLSMRFFLRVFNAAQPMEQGC